MNFRYCKLLTLFSVILSVNCGGVAIGEILNADFVGKRALSITSAIGTDFNQLELQFAQNLINTEAVAAEQFFIQRDDTGDTLLVTGFVFDESTPSALKLITGFQFADAVYTLHVFGLEGEDRYGTPAGGIQIQFTGFNPNSVAREFRVVTPATAVDNQPFEITVDAVNSSDFSFYVDMTGEIDITTTGSGSLTIENEPGWIAGTQTLTVRYNGNLGALESEDIAISIEALNNSAFNGLSSNIAISSAVELDRFTVSAPANASVNEMFAVTITAVGSDNKTFKDYAGTVSLDVIDAYSGNLNKITAAGFANGVLTTNLRFSGFADSMKIRATDTGNTSAQGESGEITVGFGTGNNFTLNLTGVPLTDDKVRLSWQEVVGAFLYKVYRRPFATGNFSEVAALSSTARDYLDAGLTDGQEYEYKVSAIDSGAAVMTEATVAVTSVTGCGVTISGGMGNNSISTGVIWEKADSPFCIVNEVTVTGSLLIEAGVVILFNGNRSITVNSGGSLAAFGTSSDKIIFTSMNDAPSARDWGRIYFTDGAVPTTFGGSNQYVSGSGLGNVIVEYGNRAIRCHITLSIDGALFRYNESSSNGNGGAVEAVLSSETLVIRNSNISTNNTPGDGGAIVATGTGNIEIDSSVFENNVAAGDGGAIHSTDIDLAISNSFFRDNTGVNGGAIYLSGGNHTVSDSILLSNLAGGDGGAVFSAGQLDLKDSLLQGNSASGGGGGIYLNGVFVSSNNVFQSNSASSKGGAIFHNNNQMATFTYNSFLDNTSGNDGGAISFGAPRDRVITNSLFQNNDATADGGAINLGDGSGVLNLTHNNIFDNTASGTGFNFQNNDGDTQVAGENYFGNDITDKTTMGICDGTASSGTCGAGVVDTTDPGDPVIIAWPLCSVNSGHPDCVGADF